MKSFAAVVLTILAVAGAASAATDGTWIYDGHGNWSDATKWLDGHVADGADQTAYFTLDISDWREVTLDSERIIGHLVFSDPGATPYPRSWWLQPSGWALTLATTAGVPTITTNTDTVIKVPIGGSQGFQKLGSDNLSLAVDNTYTGVTTVSEGGLYAASPNALGASGSGNQTVVADGAYVGFSGTSNEDFTLTGTGYGNGALVADGEHTVFGGEITLDGNAKIGYSGDPKSLSITGDISLPDSAMLTLEAKNATEAFAVHGTIHGTGGLTLEQGGANLYAANTYSGDTVVDAHLKLMNDNAVQNSTVQMNQSSLQFDDTVLNPNFGGLNGLADLDLNPFGTTPRALTVGGNGQDTGYWGSLQGDGSSLTKIGAGTLILGGNNTYTGVTTVSEGGLRVTSSNGLGAAGAGSHTVVADGASVQVGATTSEDFIITGSGPDGRGALLVAGDGTTIQGSITLDGDARIAGADHAKSTYLDGDILLPGSAMLTVDASDSDRFDINGTIQGTGGLVPIDYVALHAANTFSGDTVINDVRGVILQNDNALQNSTVLMNASGLEFGDTILNPNLGGLAGSADLDLNSGFGAPARALTVGGNGQDTTYSGRLQGDGSSLTKTGAGTLTLTGDNTYTAGTSIDAGMLVAGHNKALGTGSVNLNGGALQVAPGTTISNALTFSAPGSTFGGSGTYLGSLDVGADGIVAPGSSPGLLTITGDYAMDPLATLEMELGGALRDDVGGLFEYDVLKVGGAMTLAGTLDVTLWNGFNPVAGDSFDLLDWGTLAGTFDLINLPTLTGGLVWDDSALYATGTLSVSGAPSGSPVPVPGAAALALFGLMTAAGLVRRRR